MTGKQQKASEIWNRKKAMKVEKKRIQKKIEKSIIQSTRTKIFSLSAFFNA